MITVPMDRPRRPRVGDRVRLAQVDGMVVAHDRIEGAVYVSADGLHLIAAAALTWSPLDHCWRETA